MLSEKDRQFIEHILTIEIECQRNNGAIVFIPFREFISKSIMEIDRIYLFSMLDDYKKSNSEFPKLLISKFEEFFNVKPFFYYKEFPESKSVTALLYFSYSNFFTAYNYLKETNKKVESKKIYYSKFKTTGLFYSFGEYVFTIYSNDTIGIHTSDLKTLNYSIESLFEDKNDKVFIIRSLDNKQIGEFRLQPMGKAELSFGGKVILKLKI